MGHSRKKTFEFGADESVPKKALQKSGPHIKKK